jgi:ketosteroid isomerase-like protein
VSGTELTRLVYDLANRREMDSFLAMLDEDIVIESRLAALEGSYTGHEGFWRWWDSFYRTFPDYRIQAEEIEELGDFVLVHALGMGHAQVGEVPLVDPFWHALHWREGKLLWWRNCRTEQEARDAIAARGG